VVASPSPGKGRPHMVLAAIWKLVARLSQSIIQWLLGWAGEGESWVPEQYWAGPGLQLTGYKEEG
jgi:hypothetical protein